MAVLFYLPFRPVYDGNMRVVSRAKAYFTLAGSNVASAPYQNEALTVPHTNPVRANSVGRFPTIWLNPALSYRVRLYDADGRPNIDTPLEEYDPYTGVLPGSGEGSGGPVDIGDVTGLPAALAAKADATATEAALAAKADSETTALALSAKADATALSTALAEKASIVALAAGLAGKQDLHAHLTAISQLSLVGKAGYTLVVNGSETGFELSALGGGEILLSNLVWESGGDVLEDADVGTVVGVVGPRRVGSTLALTDDAGGLFDIDNATGEVSVAAALDFEDAATLDIEVEEDDGTATNSPRLSTLTVGVVDVAEGGTLPSTNATLTTTSGDPPEVNISNVVAGRYLHIERDEAGGDYSSLLQDVLHLIGHDEETTGQITNAALAEDGYTDPTGAGKQRYRYEDDIGGVGPWSEITYNVTVSVAVWATTTGNDKSQYLTISGTPALTAKPNNASVGSHVGVRTLTEMVNDKAHWEYALTTLSAGVRVGITNATDSHNPTSSAPGSSGTRYGACIQLGTGGSSNFYRNGSVTTLSDGAWATGDIAIVEVDRTTNTIAFKRRRAGVTTSIASVVMTTVIPVDYHAYLSENATNTTTEVTVNFGGSTFADTPTAGYDIYG